MCKKTGNYPVDERLDAIKTVAGVTDSSGDQQHDA